MKKERTDMENDKKKQMKVGAAQVDITPKLPFTINSSFHMRIAKQILDPLYASCIVVECDGSEIMFVSCDLANIKYEVIEIIKTKIISKIPILKERISELFNFFGKSQFIRCVGSRYLSNNGSRGGA